MIDWARVADLREDLGDDEFAPVLELFLDEVETTLMRLDPADGARLADDLHAMKGAAANLGFADFAALCDAGAGVGALNDCYTMSKRALVGGLARMGAVARVV
ncbi:MAG: Hpt domain-containing protein [Paracoccus sp. (in: a-proteobacteria)]|nr:Hpt domain-containing protein [Paracoccus sp. (in: a-proteobacteria)]